MFVYSLYRSTQKVVVQHTYGIFLGLVRVRGQRSRHEQLSILAIHEEHVPPSSRRSTLNLEADLTVRGALEQHKK